MTGRVERLVAQDYDGGRDITPVLAALRKEEALVAHTEEDRPHWRDAERMIPTHYIDFDTSKYRNTHAHGLGCRYGFVCHVENIPEEEQ